MDIIQCQINITDAEYKIDKYLAGDGFISIVDDFIYIIMDGNHIQPAITNAYWNVSGTTTVFINSRKLRFNITIRPKNPCKGDYAKKTCPHLECKGENYQNVRCECRSGPTKNGTDKYHPTCGK